MKKNLIFLLFSLLIVVSLVMVGCSSSPSPTAAPPQTTQAIPPPSTSAVPSTTAAPPPTSAPASSAASASPTSSTPANVITLKYADQNPADSPEGVDAAKPWLAQITKATNGRVQFQTYFSQSLAKGPDIWNAVMNGVADVGWMFHGYWANMTPLADVVSLPFLPFNSAQQASGILWQLYEKYPTMASEFKDNHVLLTFTSDPYFLITSKKQVKTMDDLKGLKIRVTSGPPVDMMKALGGVPVMVPMPDNYLDLQKGVIDGMLTPWNAMLDFKLYEVVKYYTYVPTVTVYFTQAMNNNTWNSLPPDVQQEINSVCGLQGSLFWGKNMFDVSAAAGPGIVKKAGYPMITYTLPPDEFSKWSAIAGKPIWDDWVKKMTAAGHPEAQDMLNTTQSLIKSYNP